MKIFAGRETKIVCGVMVLVLAACNFPFIPVSGITPTPDSETEGSSALDSSLIEEFYLFDQPEAGSTMLWLDSSTVVFVPGGEFSMGQDEVSPSDHRPAHSVSLDSFWIYQAEVTNQMYANCVALGVCSPPDLTDNEWYSNPEFTSAPVTGVTWQQAETYCEWVEARLPTEAEWELAARGTDAATYPWGEDDPTCSLLNFQDCLDHDQPQTVRFYPLGASPYDLADMAGNAAEWVYDWYSEDYYAVSPPASPAGPETGTERVVRGSSFNTPDDELEIYLRDSLDPVETHEDLGFRCVLTGDDVHEPVVPNCTTAAYSPAWPYREPFPEPSYPLADAVIQLYCNLWASGDMYDTLGVRFAPGTDTSLYTIESSYGPITCEPDSGDPLLFNCWGPGLHPGSDFSIAICPVVPPLEDIAEMACPTFYTYNPATDLCEYSLHHIVADCDPPNVVVPGYGCLAAPDDMGGCPTGYYEADFEGSPVCVPAAGSEFCSATGACAATCPEGLTFNPTELCCEYPPDVEPSCPDGYYLDMDDHMCHPNPIQVVCRFFDVTGPTCGNVETPPPDTQTGCWVVNPNFPDGRCIDPCPVGASPGTPCTP